MCKEHEQQLTPTACQRAAWWWAWSFSSWGSRYTYGQHTEPARLPFFYSHLQQLVYSKCSLQQSLLSRPTIKSSRKREKKILGPSSRNVPKYSAQLCKRIISQWSVMRLVGRCRFYSMYDKQKVGSQILEGLASTRWKRIHIYIRRKVKLMVLLQLYLEKFSHAQLPAAI